MHAYCVEVLHFSEDAAFKRIRAARVARRALKISEQQRERMMAQMGPLLGGGGLGGGF